MDEIKDYLKSVRVDYNLDSLDASKVNRDPLLQFASWMQAVIDSGTEEPNIMFLATADQNAKPSCRVVLLRNFDAEGFVFFTNYHSAKGTELEQNPYASMIFFWSHLHKQVRIDGVVSKVEEAESDAYFRTRPRESQIGAWASIQSQKLPERQELEKKVENLTKEYEGREVPRPLFWGGYRVRPYRYEFWQGRPNRLHDRVCYETEGEGKWKISLLYP
jgi:pyridoxamine 5'-phosphate oxidase